jgi:hypothetical protein
MIGASYYLVQMKIRIQYLQDNATYKEIKYGACEAFNSIDLR